VRHKLGALPPVRPSALGDLADYAKLPTPPASVAVPAVADWGTDGNQSFGNCTIAGAAHCIAAWNAESGSTDPTPTEDQTVTQYKAITGCVTAGDAHDTGLVLSDVLKLWSANVGLFGDNKIAGYAPVNHKVVRDIHSAIAAYGVTYVGVALPESAETQFGAGQPWTLVGDPPVGGHCIDFVGYDPEWLYACTWGGIVKVAWAWWAHYGQEAWAIIPQEFVEAGKGPEIDLAQLQGDIKSLDTVKVKRPWWEI